MHSSLGFISELLYYMMIPFLIVILLDLFRKKKNKDSE